MSFAGRSLFRGKPGLELVAVRRRLELLLKALHDRDFTFVADPARPAKWWERFFADVRSPLRSPEPVAALDAEHIVLPVELPQPRDGPSARDRYRLLAMAAAERLVRGTLAMQARCATAEERELFWVREGILIDRAVVERLPALAPTVEHARARIRAARPQAKHLTPRERVVEALVQRLLAEPVLALRAELEGDPSAAGSVEWARARAATLASLPRGFGGIAPVGHWGMSPREPLPEIPGNPMMFNSGIRLGAIETRTEREDGRGAEQRADSDGRSQSSTPGEGQRTSSATAIGDGYDSGRTYPRRRGTPRRYAEWDGDRHRYVHDAVTVWTETAPASAEAEAGEGATVMSRRLRAQFEQLRAQRQTSRRQFSGDAIDLAALTDALVDRRMGRTPDDRLYERTQTNRRPLAIGVLLDVSGSTGNQLEDGSRIIDLEKQALLMAHDALDAIGDAYGLFAFAGLGPEDVQVLSVKEFAERGSVVGPRVAALQPDQNTRLGAAIRHVARVLGAQPAPHQLLLVITDGRPNDVGYHEEYAVADSRRAILDARNDGIVVFALAIDFEDHEYLAEVFGTSGYVYVRDPHSLGRQLLTSIASLVRT